jgi:hypothetical protein
MKLLFVCIIFLSGTLNYLKASVESSVLFASGKQAIQYIEWVRKTLQQAFNATS